MKYFDAPEFNPDAGRQEAYNLQWKAYIDNLSLSNKKINLNKAKQYFDTQFDQDWYNETGQRQQLFNKIFQPSREQLILNSANAYNEFKTNLLNSFAKPAPKLKTEGLDFSNVLAVQNWLLANNYNPGKADNMYGVKTKAAIDALLNNANSGLTEEEKLLFRNFLRNTRLVGNKLSTRLVGNKLSTRKPSNINNGTTIDLSADAYERNIPLRLIKKYLITTYNEDPEISMARWQYIMDRNNFFKANSSTRRKNGGIINKHQQGGTMQNEQELQKAFIAYLIQDAQAQGIQLQSEQDLLAYAELLGEDGIKAKYQEFMLKMQGGVMARLGAKLKYYKKLKGVCPEGEELVYFKQGGRICKACQKALKGTEITKKANEVDKFKAGRALYKKDIKKDACGSKMK